MRNLIHCYACSVELTSSNESEEHILPNAIGGRLKSKQLLCRKCNNDFGNKHEAEFADQLRFFSGRLPIKRDRGDNQKFRTIDKKTGLPVVIDEQGKVTLAHVVMLEKPDPVKGGQLKFMAPDEESAKKVVERYKQKFPKAKIEIGALQSPEKNPNDHIDITAQLGGLSFLKTAQKCLLNLFVHEGGDRTYIRQEADELFENANYEPRIWFLSDLQDRKPTMCPPHVLAVFGRPEESILFGYVEFFGGIRLVGVLNDSYQGPPIYFTHSVDPVLGSIQKCDVDIQITREQLLDIVNQKAFDAESFSAQLGAAESSIKSNHYFSNIIDDVMKRTLLRPENLGKIITPEMINEMAYEMGQALMPSIAAASKKRHEEAQRQFERKLAQKDVTSEDEDD